MDNNLHKVETLTDEELEQIVGGSIAGFGIYIGGATQVKNSEASLIFRLLHYKRHGRN
ncbi:ComC/BlpC family leader-containing pheromone/bacteriocin [Lactobacillus delbrueckii]|uniref:ComC/BlpC family leader-containing pheromone/bacteriocin n=1 Tax=Lactobacillus delbrueckii TaxID=1584 RepID=UPI000A4E42F4|nr:ComC/BlpC family leader-containing pheromone/bacteriocin [Lactobacillus delbrueckii]TDG63718.1 hypothetical protein C5L19_000277 [Lactobacillus delbrueckii subsp. jakobsenii]